MQYCFLFTVAKFIVFLFRIIVFTRKYIYELQLFTYRHIVEFVSVFGVVIKNSFNHNLNHASIIVLWSELVIFLSVYILIFVWITFIYNITPIVKWILDEKQIATWHDLICTIVIKSRDVILTSQSSNAIQYFLNFKSSFYILIIICIDTKYCSISTPIINDICNKIPFHSFIGMWIAS